MLAVGLVLATVGVVAIVGHALVGLSWAAAFVLGTIIAPADPVAATSVASKTGLLEFGTFEFLRLCYVSQ